MESNKTFKLSDDVVYRVVGEELVLIEVSTGTFYHFSQESRSFFDLFQEPQLLSDLTLSPESQNQALLDMLIEKKIIVPCAASENKVASEKKFFAPKFLRIGEERLDQARFLY